MTASAMVISGDARVSASYGEVTVDESINGVYLNAGVDSNGRPHYSVDGQGAIHGVGFEVFIEYDPGAGWDIKAYQDGSFMTNWDQGYAGTEETPDLVANYGIHSGSNGVPPVVTALAGTPRTPAVLTEDFTPGAATPPPVITA
jgi:hypothetical protein